MRTDNHNTAEVNQMNRRAPAQGVALIFTLLILTLLMVLSLGMVIALSSQTFIGGYYRSFRGAFYSADSGVNVVRQALLNSVINSIPATISVGTAPLSANAASGLATGVNSSYNSWTSINSGQSQNSWPGQFEVNSSNPPTLVQTGCVLEAPVSGTLAGSPFTSCTSLPSVICGAGITTNCAQMTSFVYTYSYTVDVYGNVKGTQQQSEVTDSGNFNITVNISPPTGVTTNKSFAYYGMFIDKSPPCTAGGSMGSPLAYGEITGPMFTNGSWNFASASGGSYIIPGLVQQAGPAAMYAAGSSQTCTAETSASGIASATTMGGLQLNQPGIALPQNSFNQLEAVLDSLGCSVSASSGGCPAGSSPLTIPTSASALDTLLSNHLKDASGNAYSSTGETSGVYLPYTGSAGSYQFNGGGIYVEGSASIVVAPGTDSDSQIYTITQGGTPVVGNPVNGSTTIDVFTSGTHQGQLCTLGQSHCSAEPASQSSTTTTTTTVTYTVAVDATTNKSSIQQSTSVSSSTTTTITQTSGCGGGSCYSNTTTTPSSSLNTLPIINITGVPQNLIPPAGPATMLYVDGTINSLSGPSNGLAIQNGTELTITAAGNVNITGNIQYVTNVVYGPPANPATGSGSNSNADALIPNTDSHQVLGIFTAGGNVNLDLANSSSLEIDGSIATISNGGTGAIINTGASISTLTIVGGRIQNTIQNIGASTRNVWFDQRFKSGFAPPWFPSSAVTTVPSGVENSTAALPTVSRIQWLCKSCQ